MASYLLDALPIHYTPAHIIDQLTPPADPWPTIIANPPFGQQPAPNSTNHATSEGYAGDVAPDNPPTE